MTKNEFQRKYHDYATDDSISALVEAMKVNQRLIDCTCRPVKIGNRYCLMLNEAADLIQELGIIE